MHLRLGISGKPTSPVPFLPFPCIFSNRLGLLGSSQRASCVSSSASCANPSSKRCLARKAHQTARFSSLSISAWAAADLGWEKPGLGFWRFPKVNFPNISQLSCSVWPKSSKGLQHRFTLTACNILDKQSGKSKASRMILRKQFPDDPEKDNEGYVMTLPGVTTLNTEPNSHGPALMREATRVQESAMSDTMQGKHCGLWNSLRLCNLVYKFKPLLEVRALGAINCIVWMRILHGEIWWATSSKYKNKYVKMTWKLPALGAGNLDEDKAHGWDILRLKLQDQGILETKHPKGPTVNRRPTWLQFSSHNRKHRYSKHGVIVSVRLAIFQHVLAWKLQGLEAPKDRLSDYWGLLVVIIVHHSTHCCQWRRRSCFGKFSLSGQRDCAD